MNNDYESFFEQLKNIKPTRNEQDFNIQDEYMQLIEEIAYHGSANSFGKILPRLVCFAGMLAEAKVIDGEFYSRLEEKFKGNQTKAAINKKKEKASDQEEKIRNAYFKLKNEAPKITKEKAAIVISKMQGIDLKIGTIRRKIRGL